MPAALFRCAQNAHPHFELALKPHLANKPFSLSCFLAVQLKIKGVRSLGSSAFSSIFQGIPQIPFRLFLRKNKLFFLDPSLETAISCLAF